MASASQTICCTSNTCAAANSVTTSDATILRVALAGWRPRIPKSLYTLAPQRSHKGRGGLRVIDVLRGHDTTNPTDQRRQGASGSSVPPAVTQTAGRYRLSASVRNGSETSGYIRPSAEDIFWEPHLPPLLFLNGRHRRHENELVNEVLCVANPHRFPRPLLYDNH